MAVVSDLYKYISGCIYGVDKRDEKPPHVVLLVSKAKELLESFDEQAWRQGDLDLLLVNYFVSYDEMRGDELISLAMFVVCGMKLDIIVNYNLDYVHALASELIEAAVPVDEYDKYLNMFLDRSVYEQFESLSSVNQKKVLDEAIDSKSSDLDETSEYKKVSQLVSECMDAFSPVFGKDYSLAHVYDVLEALMCKKEFSTKFSEEDKYALSLIGELEYLDKEEKGILAEKIAEVESTFYRDEVALVKTILIEVSKIYFSQNLTRVGTEKIQ